MSVLTCWTEDGAKADQSEFTRSTIGCVQPADAAKNNKDFMTTINPTVKSTNNSTQTAGAPTHRGPFAIMTVLFFMWGFITVLNDILIPRLQDAFVLTNYKIMFIQTAFFVAYFIADILHYVSAALMLRYFTQHHEKKLYDTTGSIEGEIDKPRWVDWPAFIFFIIKGLLLVIAFAFIGFHILMRLVCSLFQ